MGLPERVKYFLEEAIFQVPPSSLGPVHQSLRDVLQPKGKCISQSGGIHPGPRARARARRSGKGLGDSQPLSSKTHHLGSACVASAPRGNRMHGWVPTSLALMILGGLSPYSPCEGGKEGLEAAHSLLGKSR